MSNYADQKAYNEMGCSPDFRTAGYIEASGTWIKVSSGFRYSSIAITNLSTGTVLIGASGIDEDQMWPIASGEQHGFSLRSRGLAQSGQPDVSLYAWGDVNSGGVNVRVMELF